MVPWAVEHIIVAGINSKAGELQSQHLPTRYLYRLCLLVVVRIIFGVVLRGDNTCGKQSFKLNSAEGTFSTIVSTLLTLAATAVWRAS